MPPIPPSLRRVLAALGVVTGASILAYGCGTDAVGIEACRRIEEARCDAAPACTGDPDTFGIRSEEQVENCKSLYRDQCLHGLENAGSSDNEASEPSDGDIDRCISAIKTTASCKSSGIGTMAECADVKVVAGWGDKTPCQTLNKVENLEACTFVAKDAVEEDGTTASTSGTGGSGGSGGGGGG